MLILTELLGEIINITYYYFQQNHNLLHIYIYQHTHIHIERERQRRRSYFRTLSEDRVFSRSLRQIPRA